MTAWQHHAACRDEDLPDIFFPTSERGDGWQAVIDDATAICRRCPVTSQCLTWALDQNITDGIWGGHTESQRRTLRRKRRTGTPA